MAEIIKSYKENIPAMRFIEKNILISEAGGRNGLPTAGLMKLRKLWEELTLY